MNVPNIMTILQSLSTHLLANTYDLSLFGHICMDPKRISKVSAIFCKWADLTESMIEAEPITQRSPISKSLSPEAVDVKTVRPKPSERVGFEITVKLDDGSTRRVRVEADLVAENILMFDPETGEDVTDQVSSGNFDDRFVRLLSHYAQ